VPHLPAGVPPLGALVVLVLAAASTQSPAADPGTDRTARPAPLSPAVLYNSTRFVTWPADVFATRQTPLTVCILGTDPFGPELDAFLAGKTVNNRRVVVRRGGPDSELGGCHVLFVGASESARLERVFAGFGRGVLTVSDIPRFAERGGMIGFVRERSRVGFEINAQAAQDADLDVSSKLLKLARVIR
jgi:uncharacterized protein DUF4154